VSAITIRSQLTLADPDVPSSPKVDPDVKKAEKDLKSANDTNIKVNNTEGEKKGSASLAGI
jgi:hypothetical protein